MTNNKTNLKKRLGSIAFEVTQNAKTEGPFTGKYFDFFEKGTYHCICCNKDLFDSDKKFKSLRLSNPEGKTASEVQKDCILPSFPSVPGEFGEEEDTCMLAKSKNDPTIPACGSIWQNEIALHNSSTISVNVD